MGLPFVYYIQKNTPIGIIGFLNFYKPMLAKQPNLPIEISVMTYSS